MTTIEHSTAADYEEPSETALRDTLGLRPTHYGRLEAHPDTAPCPPWCWIGLSHGEFEHELSLKHPMTATHRIEGAPSIVASLYGGGSLTTGGDPVEVATIIVGLAQNGSSEPVVEVSLRQYVDRKLRLDDALNLSVADARELVSALTYVVGIVDGESAD
jgi:hypothetical protein